VTGALSAGVWQILVSGVWGYGLTCEDATLRATLAAALNRTQRRARA